MPPPDTRTRKNLLDFFMESNIKIVVGEEFGETELFSFFSVLGRYLPVLYLLIVIVAMVARSSSYCSS